MDADYMWVDGIPFPKFTVENLELLRDEFVVKDEDVITLSYPKSGTNWLLEIISLIHSRGDPSWVQSVVNWDRSPWLENVDGYEEIRKHRPEKGPRFYTSHLPIQFFPRSFFSSKAKDRRGTIELISQFLGYKLTPEELSSVLKNISFQVMKDNKMSNFCQLPDTLMDHSKAQLIRKGITGDWKNHFTVALSETFDKVYEKKMAGLPREAFPWE
ncbi:sulfotransferase 2A1-like [Dasypus novemcinctus]|uniref:sulfotransferase 2A1-like n=1 Tax=Dasypus novemcinctus TaxID=9361 RepID=UPI0039C9F4F0